jgi:uncharacterized protein
MFEKLNLSHQALIVKTLSDLNFSLSEYSFANLYLFRKIHQYEIGTEKNLFIKGITRKNESFIMPLFLPSELFKSDLRALIQSDFVYPISEEQLPLFDPQLFSMTYFDGDSDYLFRKERFQNYPGRTLSKKRNLVNQFLSHYSVKSSKIDKTSLNSCVQVLEVWQNESSQPLDQTDYTSCKEALQLMDTLGLIGAIYSIEDEPAGFLLGEFLNKNQFVIRFAKASRKFIGIYPFMYQSFARDLPTEVEWINLESDLGMNALQQAKGSYLPDRLVRKYRIGLKIDP